MDEITVDAFYLKLQMHLRAQEPGYVVIKRLKGKHGYFDGNRILIDPRKEFFSTIIHECLHDIFPEWTETKVSKTEKSIMAKISSEQVVTLLTLALEKT